MIHDFEVKSKEKFQSSDLSLTKQFDYYKIFQVLMIENNLNKV